MTLKEVKKMFCVTEFKDLGIHLVQSQSVPGAKYPAYVSEWVMRRKTTGNKTVRFRVELDEHFGATATDPKLLREEVDRVALSVARQILDQL